MATLKTISLFTGAGGLDYGFEAAGFRTSVCVESDDDCVDTLTSNRRWRVLHGKIQDIPSDRILSRARLKEGDASVLIGGPPCQPFSKSAFWVNGDTKRLRDPRANTLTDYFRVLRDTLPEAFLLENVPGMGYRRKREALDRVEATVARINKDCGTNYTLAYKSLNAARFGVPQKRERLFVVGHREGVVFEFPEPTHELIDKDKYDNGSHGDYASGLPPALTAWDAIGDLKTPMRAELEPQGQWAGLLPSIPEGENYLAFTPERSRDGRGLFGYRTRYWSFLLKLARNQPAWTLTANPGPSIGPFHWDNRRLSPREMARIQTFPKNIKVKGSYRSAQRQIGNAVPSALAEVLAIEIRRQLLEPNRQISHKVTLLPARRRMRPSPKPPKRLSESYVRLLKRHRAHPGEGRGPGARE